MSGAPAWISAAQVGAAFLSPMIGAMTAILTLRWESRDSLVGSVDWVFDYDPSYGAIQYPFLMVQNRSLHSIHVTSLEFSRGILLRKGDGHTALEYDDPIDLDFPYEIESGKTKTFALDQKQAARLYGEDRLIDRIASSIGRKPFLLIARTMSGKKQKFSALRAIPFPTRPGWAANA